MLTWPMTFAAVVEVVPVVDGSCWSVPVPLVAGAVEDCVDVPPAAAVGSSRCACCSTRCRCSGPRAGRPRPPPRRSRPRAGRSRRRGASSADRSAAAAGRARTAASVARRRAGTTRPPRPPAARRWSAWAAGLGPGAVRDLGERLARHRAELRREHARPGALVGRLGETVARLLGDAFGQLSEQVVGDQRAALGREPGVGSDSVERRERPRPHRRAVDREQPRDVVVAAAALQHEIEDRALVGGERVERRHRDRLA